MEKHRKTTRDFITDYCKENNIDKTNITTLNNVFSTYIDYIVQHNLYDNKPYKIPSGLGYLFIGKGKFKTYPSNWVESKKNKKHTVNMNFDSDGYIYRFKWEKPKHIQKYLIKSMTFEATRAVKRNFAKLVKEYKYLDFRDL